MVSAAAEPLALLARDATRRLRERAPGGLEEAVRRLLDRQKGLLDDCLGGAMTVEELHGALNETLATIVRTLAARYDALDRAVDKSELPFAEIDHGGRIVYANAAFAEQVADPVGRDFAALFGTRTQHVAEALQADRCASLRAELECEGLPRQFRAEIGPLLDQDGRPGHYALLLGLRAEELRLDAALDAIMRVDLTGTIVFANAKALELLQAQRQDVLGTALHRWLAPRNADGQPSLQERIARWLATPDAQSDDDLALIGPDPASPDPAGPDPARPVNLAVVPFYDGPERRSGILITFRDAAEDLAREALRRLLVREKDWRTLVREAMRIVRTVIPCDLAIFGTYSDRAALYRAELVEPPPGWRWGTRWFDVSAKGLQWLQEERTWTDRLSAMVDSLAPDQKTDPVVVAVKQDKLQNMVCLPIRGTGGEYRSQISLLSKDQKYGARDLRVLRELGLEEVFLAAQAAMEKQQEAHLDQLKRRLDEAPTVRHLAVALAKGVVEGFGWEYAAVFRVDRKAGDFELFEEHDTTPDQRLSVGRGYRQKLAAGMLGHCYRREKVLVLPRVGQPGRESYDYIRTAGQESAMTIPLRLNGRIEFILDIEASQENAFAGSDKRLAEQLAADCEQILASRWFDVIGRSLMDTMEQAALIVDDVGSIRRMNAAARAIFGDAKDVALSVFGAEPDDRRVLGQARNAEPLRVVLSPAKGVRIPTLASQQLLHDDYGHRLWLFSNLAGQRRELDRRFLEETVNEVARQTRAPLMIADGLLRGAADLLRDPTLVGRCADLLDRAANQLLKADLTYDRLTDALSARGEPTESPQPFEVVELLRQTVERLPEDDREKTRLDVADDLLFAIEGWPDRLGYAFRSILGFLLLSAGKDGVVVTAGPCDDDRRLRIVLAGRRPAAPGAAAAGRVRDGDPIAQGEEHARRMVALSPNSVRKSIELHRGEIVMPRADDLEPAFVITLPRHREGQP